MEYSELFRATEEKYGLPAGYLSRTAQIESGNNPNAKNPKSTAGGLFQFLDSTSSQYGLKNKFDPYAATDAAGRLGRDNMDYLTQQLGHAPSGAELYLAHQQGMQGAVDLLRDPNRVVGGDEIDLNGGASGMTAGEFANQWINKFNGGGGAYDGEFGQDGSVPIDGAAYVDVSAPTGPDVNEQLAALDAQQKPYDSWLGEIGASLQSGMTANAVRWATEDRIDLDFRIGEDRSAELLRDMPDDYHAMVLGSGSESTLQNNLKWVEEDIQRQQKLSAGGWSATGAGLVAGVLDPVPLAAGIASGGLGVLAKGGRAAQIAYGAAFGATTNAALDYTAQEVFDDPHADPVMAGVFGAAFGSLGGALSRNRAAQDIAEEAFNANSRIAQRNLKATTAMTPDGAVVSMAEGSMGAAKNSAFMDNLIPDERAYLGELSDESVPRAFGGKLRYDVAGQMTTSSDPLARLVGFNFFDDVAGTTDHAVTPFSANTRQTGTHRQELGNFNANYKTAQFAYLKEAGVHNWNLRQRAQALDEFNRAVRDYVIEPIKPEGVNPHVVKAAGAWGRMADNYRVRSNMAGMSDLEADANYAPMVSDIYQVAKIDREFHPEAIEKMIEAAIRKHSPEMSPEVMKRMATGYWKNLRKGAYGVDDTVSSAIHRGDKDAFLQAMNDNLPEGSWLSDVEVEGLWRAVGGGQSVDNASKGISALKKRTLLDYTEKFNVKDRNGNVRAMRVADFFEADMEVLARRYSRTMSGRVAFAETKIVNPDKGEMIMDGIRSEGDLEKLKGMVTESYRKSGRPLADYEAELKKQLENIEFGWKRINGIPVWDNANSFNQWARRIKTSQFIRLMSNMGLNQFQEGWKIMALTGFKSSLSQLPSIKTMIKGVHSGTFDKDKLLTELTDMTGIGMDGMGSRVDFRMDDDRIGATASGRFGAAVDNLLDAGQAMTSHLSLMKSIHDYQSRWALKAITQQMTHMARKAQAGDGFDMTKIKPRDIDRLATLGLSQNDAKSLFKNLLTNAEFDGKKIVGMGLNKWDAEAVSLYRNYLGRYVDRLVQANDYGGLSKWMSSPVGSMFIQFRSFVFGAWAKSTLWSINHMDPKVAVLLMGEIVMGAATYMVRNSGSLATEEGREKFWNEDMSVANLIKNGFARSASASVLPMLIDSALLATPIGPQFGNARASGSPADAFLGSPAASQVNQLMRFSRGAIRAAMPGGEDMSRAEIVAGVRALPLPTNWVPFTAALGALVKDRQ